MNSYLFNSYWTHLEKLFDLNNDFSCFSNNCSNLNNLFLQCCCLTIVPWCHTFDTFLVFCGFNRWQGHFNYFYKYLQEKKKKKESNTQMFIRYTFQNNMRDETSQHMSSDKKILRNLTGRIIMHSDWPRITYWQNRVTCVLNAYQFNV